MMQMSIPQSGTMNLLLCIKTFVAVSEAGSFARAAQRLGISNAAATRHVANLEELLGGRLLQRTTRAVRITDAGRLCLERFGRVIGEIEDVGQLVRGGTIEPRGRLRITSTTLYWMHRIAPALPEFMARYPAVEVQADLTERAVDIVEEGYDLALQISRPDRHSVVARPLVPLRRMVYASPAYLKAHGRPRRPAELARRNCLVYAYAGETVEWRFRRGTAEHRVAVAGSLRSSDANTLRLAALAGLGVARGPVFLLEHDLAAGRLVNVLPDYESVDPELWVVYPSRRHLSANVRAFIDFLEEKLEPSVTARGSPARA